MADKKTNPTLITIPNGSTGQEFQIDIRDIQVSISVQSAKRLVTDAGKKTESAITLVAQAHDAVPVPLSLQPTHEDYTALPNPTPEQLEEIRHKRRQAVEANPLFAPIMEAIRAHFQKELQPQASGAKPLQK